MSADFCVCCGAIIPEGRQVCPECVRITTAAPLILKPNQTTKTFNPNNKTEKEPKEMKDYYETKKARYEYILAALDAKIAEDLKAVTTGTLDMAKRLIDNLADTRELIVSEIEYLEKVIAEENAKLTGKEAE